MKILGLHHVAFAHRDERSVLGPLERLLGLVPEHAEPGPGFVERMIAVGPGEVCLQTLEVDGPGVIDDFVTKRGNAMHHVAFEVADLPGALDELKGCGVRMVDSTPRPGGGGTMIAFVHPSVFGGLLVELVQARPG